MKKERKQSIVKFLLVLSILLCCTLSISASPMAFGLDTNFTFDTLFANGFILSYEESIIKVTPPQNRISLSDKVINEFGIITLLDGVKDCFAVLLTFSNYDTAYKYISKDYGQGMGEENSKYFAQYYSKEPSKTEVANMLYSGEFNAFLKNYLTAQLVLMFARYDRMNMWRENNVLIFTFELEGEAGAVFIKTSTIEKLLNAMM